MKTFVFALCTLLILALASCKKSEGTKAPQSKFTKAEQFSAINNGTWTWVYGRMATVTKTGQIVTAKDGTPVHIVGDLGLTAGQEVKGYFLAAGNYERPSADGTKERMKSYLQLSGNDAEFCKTMREYYDLEYAILVASTDREKDTQSKREMLRAMHNRLKREGIPLEEPRCLTKK